MHLALFVAALLPFSLLFVSGAHAEPNKAQYELQERCGKRAAEVFKNEYTTVQNTDEGQTLINYRNHYSATFNKCFFLEMSSVFATRANPKYTAQMFRLFDLNENKEYGSFYQRSDSDTPMECTVLGKLCHSQGEWEALINRYMEDKD